MTAIDTRIFGDPDACARAVTALESSATAVSGAADVLTAAPGRVDAGMVGETAAAYRLQAQSTARNLDDLERQITQVQKAVAAFGSSLRSIKGEMDTLRSTASSKGLAVTADAIEAPAMPPEGADDAVVLAYNDKVTAFNQLVPQANHLRWREDQAHSLLDSELDSAKHISRLAWFLDKAGLIPPDHGDAVQNTGYALGTVGNLASWTATWLAKTRLTTFRPRGAGSRFVKAAELSKLQTFRSAAKDVSWVAKAGKARTSSMWGKVDDLAGKAGVALAAFSGGYDQYQKDADDKSLSNAAKGARITTSVATTGMGAWVGAEVGGQVGAGVGMLVGGPPGAAVGAVVGGVIGGFAGTQAGQWVGDKLSDAAGEVGDQIAGGLKDAGGWMKDHNPFGWP